MPSATVTSKGQITIPVEVRRAMRLKPGTLVEFHEDDNGQFVLIPRTASIRDLEGCVPKLDYVPTIEQMNEVIQTAASESYLKNGVRDSSGSSENEAA